jgi:bacteriorhodopsin
MIDPVQAFNMATSSILVPTTSSSVAPVSWMHDPQAASAFHSCCTDHFIDPNSRTNSASLRGRREVRQDYSLGGLLHHVPLHSGIYRHVLESSSRKLILLQSGSQNPMLTLLQKKRLFHILTTFITAFATLSYFAMATGDGSNFSHIVVHTKNKHVPDTFEHIFRQIFWARYVDWSITTPLLLLDLAFLAGLDGASILIAIVADVIMVLTGLFAAYGVTELQKWGWYTMGCVAYLVVVYQLAVGGTRTVKKLGTSSRSAQFYSAIGTFTFVLWTLYPIVWGLGDGSRMLTVDGEILAYGVLDVLAKPVFGFWLLITHANSDASSIGGFWSEGLSREGALRVGEDEEN